MKKEHREGATHISVLSQELISGLALEKNDVVVDATINGGGHSILISKALSTEGILLGIDLDSDALQEAHERLREAPARVILKEGNYRSVDRFLAEENISHINKAVFDLGMSSRQLDLSGRGFSFRRDEPLLMTFGKEPKKGDLTAREIINEWEEEHIADILEGYGEERYAKRIAHAITTARLEKPITTTFGLVYLIEEAVPTSYKRRRVHPATKTFQALRIAVNDEIRGLEEALEKIRHYLSKNGRIGVISFHSMEDRVVKRTFKTWEVEGIGTVLTKRPLTPTPEEKEKNPRARSAKLRFFQKH